MKETPPQLVNWGPSDGLPAGIWIDNRNGPFISWSNLKSELETGLLHQLGQRIPTGCTLEVREHLGRPNWIVRIVNVTGEDVGSVWFGGDPMKNWKFDGLVRVGKSYSDTEWEVWQTFQRFSNGTYRQVE